MAGEHFVQDRREGIHVRRRRGFFTCRHLGREVGAMRVGVRTTSPSQRGQRTREAQVGELDPAGAGNPDGRRIDASMDQGRMNRIQGVGHMPQQDMGVIQADSHCPRCAEHQRSVVDSRRPRPPRLRRRGFRRGPTQPASLGFLCGTRAAWARSASAAGQRHSLRSEDTEGYRGAPLRVLRLVDVAAAFLAQEALDLEATADQSACRDLVLSVSCLRKAKGSWAE